MESHPLTPQHPVYPIHPPGSDRPRAAPSRGGGFKLVTLFGVEVRLDWSLAIVFLLVIFNLGAVVLPGWHPAWGLAGVWVMATNAAVLLFVSLLVHELAHAFTARALGVPVNRVTLFLFGGMAHLEGQPPSPMAEFFIAVVGPLTSFALGLLLTAGGLLVAGPELADATRLGLAATIDAYRDLGPGATLLLWLGPINVMLGLFNLVPGFPLDGGRALRALLWGLSGDLTKATRWASGVGQFVAWGVMAVGVMNLFRGELAGGLWLVLIGWFLNNAARVSFHQQLLRQSLEDVPVSRIMRTRLERITPELSIEAFVREHVMVEDQHAYPVETAGALVGLVSFEDVRKVPQEAWMRTPVREVMTPTAQLSTLPPDAAAEQALEELARGEVEQLPVVESGHLLGLVRRQDLMRWLALQAGPSPT